MIAKNTQQTRNGRTDSPEILMTLLLTAMAVIFSYFVLFTQSLRLDEAQSLWQTSHSLKRVLHIIATDVHVPFYHIILHFWQLFLGNGVATGRILSLLFFALTIPTVFLLGKRAFDRREDSNGDRRSSIALFATALVAISPFLSWYGSEIRMYSLLTFLTVLNQYFFISLYKNGSPRWFWYGLTAVLGMFTHYFFFFVLITEFVFYLAHRKLFAPGSFKRFVILAGIILIVFAPWIYYVYSIQEISQSQPALQEPTTQNLFNTFSQFMFGFQDDHLNTLILSLWPLAALLAFFTLNKDRRSSVNARFFFLSAVLPITLAFIFSIAVRPLYLTRYLISSVPALYLFIGWIISGYPKKLAKTLQVILIAAMAITLVVQAKSPNTPVRENFKEVAEYLYENTTSSDIIVVSAPFIVYPIEYYYQGSSNIVTLPIWNRFIRGALPEFNEAKLPQEVDQLKGSHQRMWVVLAYDQGYEEIVRLYLDTHFERLEDHNFSPGLNLYSYRLRYD